MSIWMKLLMVFALVPLLRAIWANRRTTLLHALLWGVAAWGAWVWLAISPHSEAGYVAISLTTCAGVAVLGARRPGVGAWNAVVAGLLATLFVPLGQEFLTGNSWHHSQPWSWFLPMIFCVALFNLSSSWASFGMNSLGIACLFASITDDNLDPCYFNFAVFFAGISPWLTWLPFLLRKKSSAELERMWQGFCDRFGWIWILRVQEQFRNAAKNRGLLLELRLRGVQRLDGGAPDETERAAAYEILVALLQRFGPP